MSEVIPIVHPVELLLKYRPPTLGVRYYLNKEPQNQFVHNITLRKHPKSNVGNIVEELFRAESIYFNPEFISKAQVRKNVNILLNSKDDQISGEMYPIRGGGIHDVDHGLFPQLRSEGPAGTRNSGGKRVEEHEHERERDHEEIEYRENEPRGGVPMNSPREAQEVEMAVEMAVEPLEDMSQDVGKESTPPPPPPLPPISHHHGHKGRQSPPTKASPTPPSSGEKGRSKRNFRERLGLPMRNQEKPPQDPDPMGEDLPDMGDIPDMGEIPDVRGHIRPGKKGGHHHHHLPGGAETVELPPYVDHQGVQEVTPPHDNQSQEAVAFLELLEGGSGEVDIHGEGNLDEAQILIDNEDDELDPDQYGHYLGNELGELESSEKKGEESKKEWMDYEGVEKEMELEGEEGIEDPSLPRLQRVFIESSNQEYLMDSHGNIFDLEGNYIGQAANEDDELLFEEGDEGDVIEGAEAHIQGEEGEVYPFEEGVNRD